MIAEKSPIAVMSTKHLMNREFLEVFIASKEDADIQMHAIIRMLTRVLDLLIRLTSQG